MVNTLGLSYAVGAALGHSCIDATRKIASQRFTSTELVALVALLDAVFVSSLIFGTGMMTSYDFMNRRLLVILVVSSLIKILANTLYQKALQVSPLSCTVPYLAFTPALLLFTSYMVVNEVPSSQGVAGVMVITLGGYLLAVENSRGKDPACLRRPSQTKGGALTRSRREGGGSGGGGGESRSWGADVGDGEVIAVAHVARSPLSRVDLLRSPSMGAVEAGLGRGVEMAVEVEPREQLTLDFSRPNRTPDLHLISPTKDLLPGAYHHHSGSRLLSLLWWGGRKGAHQQLHLVPVLVSEERKGSGGMGGGMEEAGGGKRGGVPGLSRRGSFGNLLGFDGFQLSTVLEPLDALRKEQGSILMLITAALLSLTTSFDKLGAHYSPSFFVFAGIQRVMMAVPLCLYLAFTSPRSYLNLIHHFPVMAAVSFFELISLVCYLESLKRLLVSYAIAAKRSNILVSVLIGNVVFKENIWRRLPYILLMMAGMALIVFAS